MKESENYSQALAHNGNFSRNRRTVVRYVNLSSVLVFRLVSQKVKKRFPDYESLIEHKLLLPGEVDCLQKIDEKNPHESTMMPILWAMKIG